MNGAKLSRPVAALVGLLGVAAALGSGHLAAAFLEPNASPFLAVGNTAIDFTPQPIKEWAIRQFGTADKLVLLVGMAVVIVAGAVVAGQLSRRSPTPGMVLAALVGLLGFGAVLYRPDVGMLGVLAPLVSLIVGVLVFQWLHGLAMAGATENAAAAAAPAPGGASADADENVQDGVPDAHTRRTGSAYTAGRRRFLVGSVGVAAGAGIAGLGGQLLASRKDVEGSRRAVGELVPGLRAPAIPPGADLVKDGTPSFITPNADFYRVDTALSVPQLLAEEWQLRVHGMVERELVLNFNDLRRRPLVEKTVTLTCVSNEVGGPYVSTSNFIGVSLRDLLNEAGVKPGADQLATRSSDGWTCGTPVDVVMEPERGALLAIGMNGEPLPVEHGFPVRMVVPGLYGYVSATKWLVDIEVTTYAAFDPYWVRRGWAKKGPIKTQSRIDRPLGFAKIPAGKVVVAGVAWAQHTGLDKVEVRMDGGPWRTAELTPAVNKDTWRMWRIEFDLPAGGHTAECRATDQTGYTQTSDRVDPIPDGATGWHSVFFTVQP